MLSFRLCCFREEEVCPHSITTTAMLTPPGSLFLNAKAISFVCQSARFTIDKSLRGQYFLIGVMRMNVKRAAAFLLLLALLLAIPVIAFADNRGLIVYIASGSSSAYRYHARADCSSLSRSVVASLTLEEAASRGFSPCSRCNPPAPDFEVAIPTQTPISSNGYYQSSTRSADWREPEGSSTSTFLQMIPAIRAFAPLCIFLLVLIAFGMGKICAHIYIEKNPVKYQTASSVELTCFVILVLGIPFWVRSFVSVVRYLSSK